MDTPPLSNYQTADLQTDIVTMLKYEQVKHFYAAMLSSLSGVLFSIAVIVWAEWKIANHTVLLAWAIFALAVVIFRIYIIISFRRANPNAVAISPWEKHLVTSTLLISMTWASAAIFLFPDDLSHQALLTLVIGGNAAAAVIILSALRHLATLFIFCSMSPLITQFFISDHMYNITIGISLIVFSLFMLNAGSNVQRYITENIMLRFKSAKKEELIRKSEQAMKESEKTYRGIFDNLGEAVYIQDKAGCFLDVNKGVTRMYGRSRESFIGTTPSFMSDPKAHDMENIHNYFQKAFAGEPQHFEMLSSDANGRKFTKEMHMFPGEYFGQKVVIAIARDISEKKELENQLLQAQKMEAIGTLVGGIAHDFNNTLAAMQGNLYLAKAKVDDENVVIQKLNNIETLSNHAAETIQQLLTFARKGIKSTSDFSFQALIQDSIRLSHSIIPENIIFDADICEESLPINGDYSQIQQVFINLMSNAIDAVADTKHPKIKCSLSAFETTPAFKQKYSNLTTSHFAHLTLSDNGEGISTEALEHVFEPFFTTKEVGKGTGLGLAMVYGTIQEHNGIINIDSTTNTITSQKTVFHIYLPLIQLETPVKNMLENQRIVKAVQATTVLLVDDETDLLETTKEVLEDMGYHVYTANNGTNAIKMFKQYQSEIALLIIDVVMPKMGGIEAAQKIKTINDVPVIFITGYDKENFLQNIPRGNHYRVVNKPFNLDILSQNIQDLVTKNEVQAE